MLPSPPRLLAEILDLVADAIVLLDSAGRVALWNRAAEDLLLWPQAEVLGHPPPWGAALSSMSSGSVADLVLPRRDGRSVRVRVDVREISGNAVPDVAYRLIAAGEPTIEAAPNPSLELREEKARKLSERLLLAHRAAHFGTWDWHVSEQYSTWDEQECALYDHPADQPQVPFETWVAFLHSDDRPRVLAELEEAMRTRSSFGLRFRVILESGEIRHLRSRFIIERSTQGDPVHVFGIDWDETREIRLRENLEAAKVRAEAASEAKSDFLAMMSHEIRTPMNAVIGFCDLLGQTPLSAEQRDYLAAIKTGGDDLLEVIDQVLDFSKVEAGQYQPKIEPVALEPILQEIVALLHPLATAHDTTLSSSFAPDTPTTLATDAFALRRILTNLVGNAIKFTDHGSITLSVDRSPAAPGNALRIAVRDTGAGLSPQALEHIFEPFHQGDNVHRRKHGGTGLGLAIAKRLARTLGGDLTAASPAAGGGSVFTLFLPLDAVPAPAPAAAPSASPRPARSHHPLALRVLVAEDNPVNQRLTALLLARLGCTSRVVSNGRDALTALDEEPFDAVLMDVQMPGMDGWEATREIRRHEAESGVTHPKVVIALTAYALADDTIRSREAGMTDHLVKPLTLESLAGALETNARRNAAISAPPPRDQESPSAPSGGGSESRP